MPLKKICPKCHKIIDAGQTYCPECTLKREQERASNNRHYDKYIRNQQSKEFYHSKEWEALRDGVMRHFKGLDIYAYYVLNEIVYAEMVHHIVEVTEDWSRRLDISNLLPLSNRNHNTIGAMYLTDKHKTQALLLELIKRWNEEFKE